MLKIKIKCPSSWTLILVISLRCQGQMTHCLYAGLFLYFFFLFETLKKCNCDLLIVLWSDKV